MTSILFAIHVWYRNASLHYITHLLSTSNQHVCIYCDIVDIAVFGDIVSALCQYRHRGNIVPIFPFTLIISSISPKCYRRTWNQYPLYHQCYLKMIRYGIWRHKLLYVFKKIAKYCDIFLYYTVYRALQFIVGKVYMYVSKWTKTIPHLNTCTVYL